MTASRLLPAALFLLLAACSSQQLYSVGQGWQKQECQRIQDSDERRRCEKSTELSYDKYKAEADAAKKAQ